MEFFFPASRGRRFCGRFAAGVHLWKRPHICPPSEIISIPTKNRLKVIWSLHELRIPVIRRRPGQDLGQENGFGEAHMQPGLWKSTGSRTSIKPSVFMKILTLGYLHLSSYMQWDPRTLHIRMCHSNEPLFQLSPSSMSSYTNKV